MQMLFCALCTINIMLFEPAQCRPTWPPWSAQRVFVDTCDEIRIRKCATPNNLQASTIHSQSHATSKPRPPIQPLRLQHPGGHQAVLRLQKHAKGQRGQISGKYSISYSFNKEDLAFFKHVAKFSFWSPTMPNHRLA